LADFDAHSDSRADDYLGVCKLCSANCYVRANPVLDDPGDCAPIISRYNYRVQCSGCQTRTPDAATVDAAFDSCVFVLTDTPTKGSRSAEVTNKS